MLQSMCTYNVKNDQDSSLGMYVLKWIGAKWTSHNLNYFFNKTGVYYKVKSSFELKAVNQGEDSANLRLL